MENQPAPTIEIPAYLLVGIHEILNSLDYECNGDCSPKSSFFGEINEDSFFYYKNQLEKLLACRK